MDCFALDVVYTVPYAAKDGTQMTKLYVPVGQQVLPVFVKGDQTALAGKEVFFVLDSRRGSNGDPYLVLKLYQPAESDL